MSAKRIWILFWKEIRHGATNFLFLYSIVMPVLLTLLVALVFGDLFAQTPRLGIVDSGSSAVTAHLADLDQINTTVFASTEALQAAVERGTVELGIALPVDFDDAVRGGQETDLVIYRWGEAGIRNLILIETAVVRAVVDMSGFDMPVSVVTSQLGSADETTWSQRLLPLILIMAVMLGGLMIPASSLIEEKTRRTLTALTVTPATLLEVYLAKTLLGFIISTLMGVVILLLNNAFGNQPGLLVGVVAMGALMASAIGIIIGSLVNSIDAFMGTLKAFGIILFAPGIVEMFPAIPAWVGRVFPTYYMMNPLLEVSQNGAGFGDVAGELAILAAIVGALLLALVYVIEQQKKSLALAA